MSASSTRGWPRRGELWWGYLPGQPDDPHQPRPLLIISVDVQNRLTDDVIAIPIFSTGILGPTRVLIADGEGGIARDSVLFCEEICTIDRDFLASGPLGPSVSTKLLDDVVSAVRHAIEP